VERARLQTTGLSKALSDSDLASALRRHLTQQALPVRNGHEAVAASPLRLHISSDHGMASVVASSDRDTQDRSRARWLRKG